ncbi:hypothetical protein, partial [Streptomyces sp.]|uniref:hypothetical protein n=1 Tax=Streptomyces sp. TaxID=1931 RepID=UPI0028120AD3
MTSPPSGGGGGPWAEFSPLWTVAGPGRAGGGPPGTGDEFAEPGKSVGDPSFTQACDGRVGRRSDVP